MMPRRPKKWVQLELPFSKSQFHGQPKKRANPITLSLKPRGGIRSTLKQRTLFPWYFARQELIRAAQENSSHRIHFHQKAEELGVSHEFLRQIHRQLVAQKIVLPPIFKKRKVKPTKMPSFEEARIRKAIHEYSKFHNGLPRGWLTALSKELSIDPDKIQRVKARMYAEDALFDEKEND